MASDQGVAAPPEPNGTAPTGATPTGTASAATEPTGAAPSGHRASSIWHPRLPARPPKIVRGPGTTVHGQIEDWLADAIVSGLLRPGDRLPTEQELAAWLGVSRMTLRHALAELAQRGLVTRTVGRTGGTFVAEPKLVQDLAVLAGFSEQLRKHGLVAGARCWPPADPGEPGRRGRAGDRSRRTRLRSPPAQAGRRQADPDRAFVVSRAALPWPARIPARRIPVRTARPEVRATATPGQGEP